MSAQSNGLVAAAQQNEAGGSTPKNFSNFPLSYSFYNTERFGEYMPFFVEEGVSGDTLPLHSTHEVRSYTMSAPLMQSLLKKKDFFYVPMQAILPLNWEKFYTNPVIGEDVPNDVGCGVEMFWNKIENLFVSSLSSLYLSISSVEDTTESVSSVWDKIFKFLVFFEYFYSSGSLMSSLGIHGNSFFHADNTIGSEIGNSSISFDDVFDYFVSVFIQNVSYFRCNLGTNSDGSPKSWIVSTGSKLDSFSPITRQNLTFREFLELLREDLSSFELVTLSLKTGVTIADFANTTLTLEDEVFVFRRSLNDVNGNPLSDDHKVPLNLSRLWAYQLVCAHFYSNDHVDFVYSAELFRQYINQLIYSEYSDLATFEVNGFLYQYDSLSAWSFNLFIPRFGVSIFSLSSSALAYFTALFHYKRSLRYMDYFTGARTRPLAIGDTSVDVADSKVDVLDLSRSRMMAKFLQAVNRSGRKFGSYMKELFGKVPAPDYHNPFYLAHTSDVVGSNETQNTADGQRAANAITSNLMTNASRYAFTFNPDRDCIVIGITYYDIPRVYIRSIERQNFFVDRFDMFNPYMQFIGDQPIYKAEIGADSPTLAPFGYQNRHMEYKQRYNQASGAFANPSTGLDNWIFVADSLRRQLVMNISPSFIRSFNSELDHFYTSLTGYSNGSYFHFIVRYDNRQDASRPMAYAPVIA